MVINSEYGLVYRYIINNRGGWDIIMVYFVFKVLLCFLEEVVYIVLVFII